MQELMRRLIADGWLRKGDPSRLWMSFVGPLLLLRHIDAAGGDPVALKDPRAFAHQHVDQFLQGAGAPSTSRAVAPRATRTRIAKPMQRRVAAKRQSS
jgi:hypothetical protein